MLHKFQKLVYYDSGIITVECSCGNIHPAVIKNYFDPQKLVAVSVVRFNVKVNLCPECGKNHANQPWWRFGGSD